MDKRTYHWIKVYNGILEQLKSIHDTEQESLDEVRHYAKHFHLISDFNIVQYGSLLVYYDDIRDFYKDCGYPNIEQMENDELWDMYRKNVGYVAKMMLCNELNPLPMDLYKAKVYIPKSSLSAVIDWIKTHSDDSTHLNHTYFEDGTISRTLPVVSVYLLNTTLEQHGEDIDHFMKNEYGGVVYYQSKNVRSMYYIECNNNVYYCTI